MDPGAVGIPCSGNAQAILAALNVVQVLGLALVGYLQQECRREAKRARAYREALEEER